MFLNIDMMRFKFFLLLFINIHLLNAQNIAFVNEAKLLEATPNYSIKMRHLDSLKNVLEIESKLLQEQNRRHVLELIGKYKIEEASLDKLNEVLKKVDPKAFEQLLKEQDLVFKTIKAKELLYDEFYHKQLAPLVDRLNKMVQDYCKSKGINVLFKLDKLDSSMAFMEPQLDITSELINHVYEIK